MFGIFGEYEKRNEKLTLSFLRLNTINANSNVLGSWRRSEGWFYLYQNKKVEKKWFKCD